MSTAQQKYSAYDRELLAIYEAVKHFPHMLEARHLVIDTDHKPLTYAFSQKCDRCSPRQFNHLEFISQFTTNIRNITGQDNVVAWKQSARPFPQRLWMKSSQKMQNSPPFCTEPPPSGWRRFRFPAQTLL